MKTKIAITLFLVLLPLVSFIPPLLQGQRPGGYSITTEKDPAFGQRVQNVSIIATVDRQLADVFANSFEHSLVSALRENGVEAAFRFADQGKQNGTPAADATMQIGIKPLYRNQSFVGTEFEATLIHTESGKQVWHAAGKVDYLKTKRTKEPGYVPGGGVRQEFAWHTTAAIAGNFISEVNGQEPKPMYTNTGSREYHGQRID